MADKKDKKRQSVRSISKALNRLSGEIDSIYQSTYSSRTDNRDNYNAIVDKIESDIDSIIGKVNNQDVSNISQLYLRTRDKDIKDVDRSLSELFDGNGNFLNTVNIDMIRSSIQAYDYQIDLICKYMPKLLDALGIKKDNVLSSDNFTKEFINTVSRRSNRNYNAQFADRANFLKQKYRVEERYEEIYDECSIHGEYFLYHVPYKKAFEELLKRKNHTSRRGLNYDIRNESVVWEASNMEKMDGFDKTFSREIMEGGGKVVLDFEEITVIPECVQTTKSQAEFIGSQTSLTESYLMELAHGESSPAITEDGLTPKYDQDGLSVNGLINDPDKIRIKDDVNGSVYQKIPRDEIIPIWIGDKPVGYLHIVVVSEYVQTMNMIGSSYSYSSMIKNSKLANEEWERQNDMLVRQISDSIADKIDAKFINANIDLKEDIYAILRYNDKFCTSNGVSNVRCIFLPAEDVEHFYFKLNPKTHRGVSDLDMSIIPAMVWIISYMNETLARMSRGQDKRVYYVKQTVEKNVARTLLNTIEQLKKGNMGMRQLENINTVFNVIGKFNDHIVPTGPDGDPPIKMEVMQGQDIQTPTELMDRMEEAALMPTDVPPEALQTVNQVDYAIRFTMSNGKFLKKVYKRQSICQKFYSIDFRKLYAFEYREIDNSIMIQLPAPAYLSTINTKQLLDNSKEYATGVIEMVAPNADEEVKMEAISLYMKDILSTYVDFDRANSIVEQAKIIRNIDVNKVSGGGSSNGDMDDEEY